MEPFTYHNWSKWIRQTNDYCLWRPSINFPQNFLSLVPTRLEVGKPTLDICVFYFDRSTCRHTENAQDRSIWFDVVRVKRHRSSNCFSLFPCHNFDCTVYVLNLWCRRNSFECKLNSASYFIDFKKNKSERFNYIAATKLVYDWRRGFITVQIVLFAESCVHYVCIDKERKDIERQSTERLMSSVCVPTFSLYSLWVSYGLGMISFSWLKFWFREQLTRALGSFLNWLVTYLVTK